MQAVSGWQHRADLGVGADAVDLAELEVGGGELLLRRAEGDPPCGGGGGGSGRGGRRGRGGRMRQAQPGGEVPIHAVVVVAGDRHRGVGGGCLSIGRGRAGRGGRGGGGAASDGGGGQRVEPSDSASRGGKAGGRNRWDCDGRSLWGRRWGPVRGAAAAATNGTERRKGTESNRATRREGNGGEEVILPQKWMGAVPGRGGAGSFAFLAVAFPHGRWEWVALVSCAFLVVVVGV